MGSKTTALKPHKFYIDMIEKMYFANVDAKNLPATLDCFCLDAIFTIQSSFTVHKGRDTGIKKMFESFFQNYKTGVHKDFVHIIDVENERCAVQFNVELVAPNGHVTKLSNANVHYFENGKFKRVFVYMSGENVLV
ncbi:MAG TPA: nuclear transport factor 2 family protein [Candidatus Dormibacteraeota bacterium]|nr:nuclear transport factor 2 family protein [Candidatus Dormibacteraeota bacterium]